MGLMLIDFRELEIASLETNDHEVFKCCRNLWRSPAAQRRRHHVLLLSQASILGSHCRNSEHVIRLLGEESWHPGGVRCDLSMGLDKSTVWSATPDHSGGKGAEARHSLRYWAFLTHNSCRTQRRLLHFTTEGALQKKKKKTWYMICTLILIVSFTRKYRLLESPLLSSCKLKMYTTGKDRNL